MTEPNQPTSTEANPYAAPSAGAEEVTTRFSLDDDQRKLITTTATLMMVAGLVQIVPTLIGLVRDGLSVESVVVTALFGVVPVFVAIAGFSLRGAAKDGSLEALLTGVRQLHVAFLVKGIAMITIMVLMVAFLAMMFLGLGGGLAAFFR